MQATGSLAVPVLRYSFGIVNWHQEELQKLDYLFILRQTRRKGALWLGCNEWLQFLQIFAKKIENPCLTSHSESSCQQCLDSYWYRRLASKEWQLDKNC
jgi:hypothetical protein